MVLSPPAQVDASTVSAINAIGAVEYVVVPNSFHYLFAVDFMMFVWPIRRIIVAHGDMIDQDAEF